MYIPRDNPYVFNCEDFLFGDENGGDFDTFAILSMKNPVGTLVEIGRYYKDSENGLIDISYDEYMERKKAYEEKKGVK